MRIALALLLGGCLHPQISTVDRGELAVALYEKAEELAGLGQVGRALAHLLPLHSPQLAEFAPRGAYDLETKLLVLRCAQSRHRGFVEEPPIEDFWYLWHFDGAYWSDELLDYRIPDRWNCDN